MAALERLRRNLGVLVAFAWMITVLLAHSVGEKDGKARQQAVGDKALAELREEYAELRAQAAEESLVRYQQQVSRANQAEALWLQTQQQLAEANQQLKERIPNVTTVYRPAPAAEPVAIPRCVFTAGWLRDYNLALGASLPASGAGTAAPGTAAAAWPAPGTDSELLESGVTPADILAHAQDYGRWARALAAQVDALLNAQGKD
ncbi:lysis protein [Stutzerimonas kirkiae]|uniref:lysis protein n=1 Tax=Stutzerimonas kirkiae TaxID=2211392 RepID=UPI0010385B70|nr:lysis protein [Stutzerimonas kirkiae]TBV10243.1 lysis protein [Stutzerimonas kirkiae]